MQYIHINYISIQQQTKAVKEPGRKVSIDKDEPSALLAEPVWKHDPLLYCSSDKLPITYRISQI